MRENNRKVGIITINDNDNYGNRLQNYAVQEVLRDLNFHSITLKNEFILNSKKKFLGQIPKVFLYKLKIFIKSNKERRKKFKEFNKFIDFSKFIVIPFSNVSNKYDYFITGSDQVWKPTYGRMKDVDFLCFARDEQKISFSASFGINELPSDKEEFAAKHLKSFKAISVREDAGKEIVKSVANRNDAIVLIDPTMMLNNKEWDKVAKCPDIMPKKKYILNYFLGELSDSRKKEIERIALQNDCDIINILDKNDPYYKTGPSEFLYLEKNAFLICTDSFHSCVFSIIYDRTFIVFNREDNKISMNSRIETLISKFNLKNREYNGKNITKENLEHDYTEAYKILEQERTKSEKFLKKALDIEE